MGDAGNDFEDDIISTAVCAFFHRVKKRQADEGIKDDKCEFETELELRVTVGLDV